MHVHFFGTFICMCLKPDIRGLLKISAVPDDFLVSTQVHNHRNRTRLLPMPVEFKSEEYTS